MIAIIEYGAGNAGSVKKALDYLGAEGIITSNSEEIAQADRIILPGVGSFGSVMQKLKEKNLIETLKKSISEGKPFLGICIGMQVLFEESEESPGEKGLGILKGKVLRFKEGKVPQIGWNNVDAKKISLLGSGGFAYFVNSYYVKPDADIAIATTNYAVDFVSAVKKDNITALQFHPEKSGAYGLSILRRWLQC